MDNNNCSQHCNEHWDTHQSNKVLHFCQIGCQQVSSIKSTGFHPLKWVETGPCCWCCLKSHTFWLRFKTTAYYIIATQLYCRTNFFFLLVLFDYLLHYISKCRGEESWIRGPPPPTKCAVCECWDLLLGRTSPCFEVKGRTLALVFHSKGDRKQQFSHKISTRMALHSGLPLIAAVS